MIFFFLFLFLLYCSRDSCQPAKIKRCHVILFLYQILSSLFLLQFVLFFNYFYVLSFFFFQLCPSHLVSFNFYISNLVLILLVVIFLDHFLI